MTLIKCGTKVYHGSTEGTITMIEIRYDNILYHFSYFDKDQNHKSIWVHEKELTIEKPQKQKIGFKNTHN
jgi:hypothetical protein